MRQLIGCGKCLDCKSKNFEISYLKCLSFEAQRDHCYQHLDYYPFVCQFESQSDGHMCGQRLITYNSCEKHLIYDHKYCLNGAKDIFDVLSSHFDYNPIEKIDELINTRLNSKNNINALSTGSPKKSLPSIASLERNDCASTSGLSNGYRLEFIDNSDEEFSHSFHYTTEEIVKSYHKKNRLEAIPDHNYMRSNSLDDSFVDNLEYIPLPGIDRYFKAFQSICFNSRFCA